MGEDSGSDRTETGVPPDDPGRGLTEWNPLSFRANLPGMAVSDGLADRLPSEDEDEDAGRLLAVPTMESIEKPIFGLLATGGDDVTGDDLLLLLDFVSSIMLDPNWMLLLDLRPFKCNKWC